MSFYLFIYDSLIAYLSDFLFLSWLWFCSAIRVMLAEMTDKSQQGLAFSAFVVRLTAFVNHSFHFLQNFISKYS